MPATVLPAAPTPLILNLLKDGRQDFQNSSGFSLSAAAILQQVQDERIYGFPVSGSDGFYMQLPLFSSWISSATDSQTLARPKASSSSARSSLACHSAVQ